MKKLFFIAAAVLCFTAFESQAQTTELEYTYMIKAHYDNLKSGMGVKTGYVERAQKSDKILDVKISSSKIFKADGGFVGTYIQIGENGYCLPTKNPELFGEFKSRIRSKLSSTEIEALFYYLMADYDTYESSFFK